jgi:hypothetical protein
MFGFKQSFIRVVSLIGIFQFTTGFPLVKTTETAFAFASSHQKTTEVFITDIELARDDGAGRGGQTVKNFRRTDNPLHCLVTLSRAAAGTKVQFVWTAVDAGGKRDEVLATSEVVTRSGEIVADGQMRLPREWPAGRYRVRATADKRTSRTVEFVIE